MWLSSPVRRCNNTLLVHLDASANTWQLAAAAADTFVANVSNDGCVFTACDVIMKVCPHCTVINSSATATEARHWTFVRLLVWQLRQIANSVRSILSAIRGHICTVLETAAGRLLTVVARVLKLVYYSLPKECMRTMTTLELVGSKWTDSVIDRIISEACRMFCNVGPQFMIAFCIRHFFRVPRFMWSVLYQMLF